MKSKVLRNLLMSDFQASLKRLAIFSHIRVECRPIKLLKDSTSGLSSSQMACQGYLMCCVEDCFPTRQRKTSCFTDSSGSRPCGFHCLYMRPPSKKLALLLLCFSFFQTQANVGSCSTNVFSVSVDISRISS